MFFTTELKIQLRIKPEQCGPGYHDYVEDMLRQTVEGTVVDEGLIVAVGHVTLTDSGKLQEGTGFILVPVMYRAVVVQLFKNEVVDCEVVEVNKLGFFGEFGPVRIFVSKSSMPQGWRYSEEDMHMGGGAAYVAEDGGSIAIRKQTAVRVRLLAVKSDQDRMLAIGTTDGEYLGPRILG
eukprot:TRINITY_DN3868_c0_g5_i1.p1 TRINITY_DN3868_c0_g5~~TRINITY_DN3868_c0_g5_i1.p1  ORF type:complete len:179 (+),score=37.17 TRINITY_DN3868_c0_g5_i1:105-641(+)